MARTAVIAGTATAASNRVSRRQAERWSQQEAQNQPQQPVAAPQPAADSEDAMAQLQKLGELHSQGILTDEEFAAKKQELLSRM
jgi:hypothetical protein